MKPILLVLLFSAVFCTSCGVANENTLEPTDNTIESRIKEVTLYRQQAWISREIKIPANFSAKEIVVTGLPKVFDKDSLIAVSNGPLKIKLVRTQIQNVDQDSKQDPAKAEEFKVKIEKIKNDLKILTAQEKILSSMSKFSSDAQAKDLNRGLLDAKNVANMAQFSMTQTSELLTRRFELTQQLAQSQEQLKKISGRLARPKQVLLTHVQLDGKSEKEQTILLKYRVDQTGWEPRITLRGNSNSKKLNFQYEAVISQFTPESWENVTLRIAGDDPDSIPVSPLLTSLNLTVKPKRASDSDPFGNSNEEAEQNRRISRRSNVDFDNARERDIELNRYGAGRQQFEIAEATASQQWARDTFDAISQQVYQVPGKVTIKSLSSDQVIQLANLELNANTYYAATPLLSSYAFRECLAVNSSGMSFPGGPAKVYWDNRMVGEMELQTIADGQKFTVGFGVDPQLRLRRELIKKTEKPNGGNRQVTYYYKLVVANFKSKNVDVRLYDRMPYTQQNRSVSVELNAKAPKLSDDGVYQRTQFPKGILRWDSEIPANSSGAKAFDLKYDYTIEFEKNAQLTTDFSTSEIESEYSKAKLRTQGGGFGGGGFGGRGGFGGGGGGF